MFYSLLLLLVKNLNTRARSLVAISQTSSLPLNHPEPARLHRHPPATDASSLPWRVPAPPRPVWVLRRLRTRATVADLVTQPRVPEARPASRRWWVPTLCCVDLLWCRRAQGCKQLRRCSSEEKGDPAPDASCLEVAFYSLKLRSHSIPLPAGNPKWWFYIFNELRVPWVFLCCLPGILSWLTL